MLLFSLCRMAPNQGNVRIVVFSQVCSHTSNPHRNVSHDRGSDCPDALSSKDNIVVLFDKASVQPKQSRQQAAIWPTPSAAVFVELLNEKTFPQPVEYFHFHTPRRTAHVHSIQSNNRIAAHEKYMLAPCVE